MLNLFAYQAGDPYCLEGYVYSGPAYFVVH